VLLGHQIPKNGRGVNKGAEEAAGGGRRRRRKLWVVVVVRTEVRTKANRGVSGGERRCERRRTKVRAKANGDVNEGI